ncbi:hypothetical protein LCI18_001599 [Fusarium solani-melongenae]|uniref:Uncharacterized protein n=1 Tax=Fusarium solani subsp. cucurbitae TaxID=2747967 RepID=A0ACD3YNV8_FUSSC|nr:hypothetical protein LCI18_001599 [Fusarium solani-melongenae]
MSSLPYSLYTSSGTINNKVVELHRKYGDVVRVAPNEVSFISGEVVWDEVYGFRTGSRKSETTQPPAMIMADGADHARYRRLLSHAFSNSALKDQEAIVQKYMALLVDGLRDSGDKADDNIVDLVKWYNFLTFDIIADLSLGSAFGCLEKGEEKYVTMINNMLRAGAQGRVKYLQPMLGTISTILGLQAIKISALKTIPQFVKFTHDRVQQRLDSEVDRPDFVSQILRYQNVESKGMSRTELDMNCIQFLIAGSETSYLDELTKEIRSRFSAQDEITFARTRDIPLLNAVIEEGLRLYPPVPLGFPRLVPKGGAIVDGFHLPANTSIYMSQFAANLSPRNFVDPESFRPERWMNDPRYAKDVKGVFQPFSFGPRVCIGKHLAYTEMRLALSKVLYAFDLELQDPERDWLDQKVWVTWSKPPLLVRLRPSAT